MLEESCIDDSVRRVLTVKFKCGLFENPYCDEEALETAMRNAQKDALSEEIAAKSLVLLKNDGVLPLKKGLKIALVGPHADSLRYPVSGYTYPAYIEMLEAGAAGQQTSFNGIADEAAKEKAEGGEKKKVTGGVFASMATVVGDLGLKMNDVLRDLGTRTLREVLAERYDVTYAKGCEIIGTDRSGFAEAVAASEQADVVVVACGGNSGWVNVTGGEGKDRQFLDLPGVQQELLEAVSAAGKPVVAVFYGPGVFAANWAAEHCAAMVEAFMPGNFAAKAVADVLDGTVNPGGKMTMTIPRTTGQIPLYYNHREGSGYHSGTDPNVSAFFSGGYVDGTDKPRYSFGHGLSYTTFALSDLAVPETVNTDGELTVSCVVKNTGDRTGDEVVQLYSRFVDAHVTRPNMQLEGFKRVTLAPGEEKKLTFHLSMAQLGYYNEFMDFVVEPGDMKVMIGNCCDNIALQADVKIVGDAVDVMGRRAYVCPVDVE